MVLAAQGTMKELDIYLLPQMLNHCSRSLPLPFTSARYQIRTQLRDKGYLQAPVFITLVFLACTATLVATMFVVPVASCLEGRLDELRIFVRQPSRPSVQLPQFGLNKTYIAKSAAVFDASSYKPGVTVVNFGLLSSIGRL